MDVVLGLAIIIGVPALVTIAAVTTVSVYLRRRNRVNPRQRTPAPLSWLWDLRAPARAHRRLRRAIRGARGALTQGAARGLPVDGLADCLDELSRHAIAVDDQLVVAGRFSPAISRSMLNGLRGEISEIEVLCFRIAAMVSSRAVVREQHVADVGSRVGRRLDALEAAHSEIIELESRWLTPTTTGHAPVDGPRSPSR